MIHAFPSIIHPSIYAMYIQIELAGPSASARHSIVVIIIIIIIIIIYWSAALRPDQN